MRIFGEIIYRFSWFIAIVFLVFWGIFFISVGHIPNPQVVLFRISSFSLGLIGFGWLVRAIFR